MVETPASKARRFLQKPLAEKVMAVRRRLTPRRLVAFPYHGRPTLSSEHITPTAKLFASRADMIASFGQMRGGVVGEVGVAHGEFSEILIDTLAPTKFVAFDTFEMHKQKGYWGYQPMSFYFPDGMTHEEVFRRRLGEKPVTLVIEKGMSHETLSAYRDESFDLLYIDADHLYEGVKRDATIAARKIKRTGIIVFNDYIWYSHEEDCPYGIVAAVNEMVIAGPWKIVGFALAPNMYCDIAIAQR